MPANVDRVDVLQEYLSGVMDRADHHGQNVNEIALTLAGAIVWKKDQVTDLKVMAMGGEMKNVLWFWAGGEKYAVAYNHDKKTIELRDGGTQGKVLHSFTNKTTAAQIRAAFEAL